MDKSTWKINTSNLGKYKECKRLFAEKGVGIEATHLDLKEIDADPIKVIAHKASQVDEHVIVEDTSLDVDGASFGVNIRWLLEHLTDFIGRKALWTVLFAYHDNQQVYIFKGTVEGKIVSRRGENGFGFDPFFQPNGSVFTLSESKTDPFNARAKAIHQLLDGNIYQVHPLIRDWNGPWQ